MLLEFSVGNYRSIREPVTLSLEAEARLSERDKTVDDRNVVSTPWGGVLRIAGIYGANASGKSNVIRALDVMRGHVLNSAREGQAGDRLPFQPFQLDAACRSEPSEFQVVYVESERQLRYGFEATASEITREWLFATDGPTSDEALLFERVGNTYAVGPGWPRDAGLEDKTRKEALHLSVAASFNQPVALSVLAWFAGRLRTSNGLTDSVMMRETTRMLETSTHGDAIRELVSALDFGIVDLRRVESDPPGVPPPPGIHPDTWAILTGQRQRIVTLRRGASDSPLVSFEMEDESAGTAKAIAMAGPVVDTLRKGGVLVVDEFDARLHTLLALQFVRLFQDPTTNPHNAQLVFVSHDTNLLQRTLLRRDQFWFTEKSHDTQATDLYSLAELRLPDGARVRNDARYEADYLQGKYGAIPFFGNLDAVMKQAIRGGSPPDE